jgi:hypothetical protein
MLVGEEKRVYIFHIHMILLGDHDQSIKASVN